ncbi:hypothetical protein [Janthinobacterium sp. TND4EL3]|uniref:hypothetical protein n=1 Tax=Janthinobacterium sp. TND4EL3 TaxID=1907311 RepID=UPI001BAF990F|nr:hypothetical protein [Janthinobacterium sp. TND4EL3]
MASISAMLTGCRAIAGAAAAVTGAALFLSPPFSNFPIQPILFFQPYVHRHREIRPAILLDASSAGAAGMPALFPCRNMLK